MCVCVCVWVCAHVCGRLDQGGRGRGPAVPGPGQNTRPGPGRARAKSCVRMPNMADGQNGGKKGAGPIAESAGGRGA